MFDYVVTLLPHIQSGRLRALAVMYSERLDLLPDVPTIVQAGFAKAMSASWSSIVVPTGTPPEAVKRIGDAVATVMREKDLIAPFIASGSRPLDLRDKGLGRFRHR